MIETTKKSKKVATKQLLFTREELNEILMALIGRKLQCEKILDIKEVISKLRESYVREEEFIDSIILYINAKPYKYE